jgi:hypothetical protein
MSLRKRARKTLDTWALSMRGWRRPATHPDGLQQRIQAIMEAHRPHRIDGDKEECRSGCVYERGASRDHIVAAIDSELFGD